MIKYRPEIDGLRAIAIFPVILFHLGYVQISGGFYGVDVFFVISGYLITSILIDQITSNRFSMFEFWIRRVKRLLPTLLIVILAVLLIAPVTIFKPNVVAVANDAIPAIFSYSNFYALYNFGDYWGKSAENSFFLHTWSLSVEEQFYLFYPLFLFVIFKYLKTFFWPIVVLTAISFISFILFLDIDKDVAFYLLPNRIWQLSLGSIASIIIRDSLVKEAKRFTLFSILGFCFIISSYFLSFNIHQSIGLVAVFPAVGAFLIIVCCRENDFIGQLLSYKSFVFIGKISYSLYLWHWPIMVLFKNQQYHLDAYNQHLINLLILVITLVLSIITYKFVENKTRNSKGTVKLVLVLIPVILMLCFFYQSKYFKKSYRTTYNQVSYSLKSYDISPKLIGLDNHLTDDIIFDKREEKHDAAFKEEGVIKKINDKDPELILLGDSHGVMWAKLIDEICDKKQISRTMYTSNATTPFFNVKDIKNQKGNAYYTDNERIAYAKSLISNIKKWSPKIVVIACRWDCVNLIEREYFMELLEFLNTLPVKIIVLNQPPVLNFIGDNNARQYLTYLGIDPKPGYNYTKVSDSHFLIKGNTFVGKLPNKFKNLYVYNVNAKMTHKGLSLLSKDNDLFYFDDDHLSYQGTKFHEAQLENLISNALK